MSTFIRPACLVALLLAFGGQRAHAQLGGILDKLQKLSGPEFRQAGVYLRMGYQPGQIPPTDVARRVQDQLRNIPAIAAPERIERIGACAQRFSSISFPAGQRYDEAAVDRMRARWYRISDRIRDLQRLQQEAAGPSLLTIEELAEVDAAECGLVRELRDLVGDPSKVVDPHGLLRRIGIFYGWQVNRPDPSRDRIKFFRVEPNIEYRFSIIQLRDFDVGLGLELGVGVNYFFGSGIESFLHPSIPMVVNIHPFTGHHVGILRSLRLGWGLVLFPPFDADDFLPAWPDMEERWELVPLSLRPPRIAIDIALSALPLFFR